MNVLKALKFSFALFIVIIGIKRGWIGLKNHDGDPTVWDEKDDGVF